MGNCNFIGKPTNKVATFSNSYFILEINFQPKLWVHVIIWFPIIFILSFFAVLNAQHNHSEWIRCTADELEQELQLTNPEFIAERDAYIQKAQQLLRENPQWRTNGDKKTTIYIPVIFHILYHRVAKVTNQNWIRRFFWIFINFR